MASSATFPPSPSSGNNSCPWNGNEKTAETTGTSSPLLRRPESSSGLRDRKKDEDAVGSEENEAEEVQDDDDGSLEWAELLLSTRQVKHLTCDQEGGKRA